MHQDTVSASVRRSAQLTAGAVLAAWLAVGSAAAQTRAGSATWKSHVGADTPDLLYRQHCAICHGVKGDGQTLAAHALEPAPRDFTSEKARQELSRAHMVEVLNKGTVTNEGKRTMMVGWKDHMSGAQIEAVVDYIIVEFMDGKAASKNKVQDHRHKGHNHGSVKAVDYPYKIKPDASRGTAIYAANCAACHGAQGDGSGNPLPVASSKPRNFHDADFREFANGFSLFSAVSNGRGHMPAWEKKLSNQDIADVAEYVLQSFVKPDQSHSHSHAPAASHDHHNH